MKRFLILTATTVLTCLCLSGAHAGSIFMKNGYIIQGPIVERNEGAVVLGWSNGKVLIHRRFIDSVSLDQAEEKRLAEDQQFQQESEEGGPYLLETNVETEIADTLPADLDTLMKNFVIDTSRGVPPGAGSADPSSTEGGTPPTDGTPVAEFVPQPADVLGEKVKDERTGISIRPPKGWTAGPTDLAFALRGPPTAEGFQPSLNVVSAPRGGLDATDYSGFLREEMGKLLEGFEVVTEGAIEVLGEKAYQVVGRGSYQGRTSWVRQVLVVKATDWWLVSAFLPGSGADDLHAAIEESFKTLELSGR